MKTIAEYRNDKIVVEVRPNEEGQFVLGVHLVEKLGELEPIRNEEGYCEWVYVPCPNENDALMRYGCVLNKIRKVEGEL
jgi:hypothetical protein